MRRRTMMVLAMVVGMGSAVGVRAQGPGQDQGERPGRGAFAGMQRVAGEVTAVSGNTLTVKTEDEGTVQVVTTDNTRVMKGRGNTVKIADLKVGDGVMAAGILDAPNKTLHAAIVFATDAAQVAEMKANLGKTYIVGRVTAIDMDNAKMTVERPDHVSQTIGFDETTSFRKGGRGMGGRCGRWRARWGASDGGSGGGWGEYYAGGHQGGGEGDGAGVSEGWDVCADGVGGDGARDEAGRGGCGFGRECAAESESESAVDCAEQKQIARGMTERKARTAGWSELGAVGMRERCTWRVGGSDGLRGWRWRSGVAVAAVLGGTDLCGGTDC